MATRRFPTQGELRQLLDYDPETGVLTWRERPLELCSGRTEALRIRGWKIWNAKYPGKVAGVKGSTCIQIKIFDENYPAHRIIWKMLYGSWPECIDHINGDWTDNRLCNLRNVTRQINQRNQKRHCTNTSGRTGVHWLKNYGCWTAQIKMNDVSHNLGRFDRFEDAVAAREEMERKYGFTGRQ